MQDIINKIDSRVSALLAFEQHEAVTASIVLIGLLALHENMALALRRIDSWQQTMELWIKTTGLNSSTDKSATAERSLDSVPTILTTRKQ